MASNIVLPNLPRWFTQRITALYNAVTNEDFDAAFDSFVAQDVSIKVNGKTMSRAQYKKMIRGETNGDVSASVSIDNDNIVAVPSDSKDLSAIGTGTVGAIFKATLFNRIIILGQTESSTVTSCMNVVVIQDPTLHHHQIGRGGGFDARRVTNIDEVLTDEQNRITVPPIQPPTAA